MKLVKVENGIKLFVSKGAKGDSIEWKGEWSPTVVYESVHVVSRGGASWISKQSANIGHDPLTDDGIWWDCMVADSLAEAARDKAQKWAENPEDVPVEPGQYSALHHKEKALDAQVAAETAEANAQVSADNAYVSESNARDSAINASISETNAQVSADNAATSESNALSHENKAYQWAENPENDEVEPGKYSALHHASKAKASEITAGNYAVDAAGSASSAFGAAADPWDESTSYSYPDVVAFTNGHTYRCIGTDVIGADKAPNINGTDNVLYWTRVTAPPEGFFELDENGDVMPRLVPVASEIFMLDENGDITFQ